ACRSEVIDPGPAIEIPAGSRFPVPVATVDESVSRDESGGVRRAPNGVLAVVVESTSGFGRFIPLDGDVVDVILRPIPAVRHDELELRDLALHRLVVGQDDVRGSGVGGNVADALDGDDGRIRE